MRMIFVFIDGLGIGENDENKNPVSTSYAPNIKYIFDNFIVVPTDCSLGVSGLPQSATGQTAIFTGVNASQALGRHLSGQPTETLKTIIHENNLFKELIRRGYKVTNSNAYRQEYLDKMLDPSDRRHRPSVTSVMTLSAGLNFRTVQDFEMGQGIYHDITGEILIESGYAVNRITTKEAAKRLYTISRNFDFTLYEHFMTDIIGHKADMALAIKEIKLLDNFLGELLKLIDVEKDILFITSDHGNIEDVSIKTHTMHKVPTVIIGEIPKDVNVKIESLIDIMPFVLDMYAKR